MSIGHHAHLCDGLRAHTVTSTRHCRECHVDIPKGRQLCADCRERNRQMTIQRQDTKRRQGIYCRPLPRDLSSAAIERIIAREMAAKRTTPARQD